MESSDYAAFEDKVKRTVYVDNPFPLVTGRVLRSAFDQFGSVKSISFIPQDLEPTEMPVAALVEMENPKQAEQIIVGMSNFPFMVSGMPRPVRALPAEPQMFDDRPREPGRTIQYYWLDPDDPSFRVAKMMKNLTRKHAAEASLLMKKQLDKEKDLADWQAETLKARFKKYEMIENIIADGSVDQLGHHYELDG